MSACPTVDDAVVWHDLECHGYAADFPLWRELAAAQAGPVLDVGAGTGRVALDLAAAGHAVVALDLEPALLAALWERSGDLPIRTVAGDAQDLELDEAFGLILVPMQTVQLLERRDAFLRRAHAHLRPGGRLALALAGAIETFEPDAGGLPLPEVGEHDGVRYASQPVAVRRTPEGALIERVRTTWARDGARTSYVDRIHLADLDAATLEREARAAGFTPEPAREIPPTDDHVGSTVVLLRA